jgi:hypothetical protein
VCSLVHVVQESGDRGGDEKARCPPPRGAACRDTLQYDRGGCCRKGAAWDTLQAIARACSHNSYILFVLHNLLPSNHIPNRPSANLNLPSPSRSLLVALMAHRLPSTFLLLQRKRVHSESPIPILAGRPSHWSCFTWIYQSSESSRRTIATTRTTRAASISRPRPAVRFCLYPCLGVSLLSLFLPFPPHPSISPPNRHCRKAATALCARARAYVCVCACACACVSVV